MLREWMLRDHYFGPTAMGDPDVTGMTIDDRWLPAGLTEEGPGWQEEMELSPSDLHTIVRVIHTIVADVWLRFPVDASELIVRTGVQRFDRRGAQEDRRGRWLRQAAAAT